MARKNKINWAIVGIGDIVRKRVGPAILNQSDSAVYLCVTRDPIARKADLAAIKPDKVSSDFNEAIKDPLVDAVYLATPTFLHASYAIQALEAGKNVLVEKPMATNSNEAKAICDVATQSQKRLTVAYYRRFWTRFQLVKDMLDQGVLGQLVLVRIVMHNWYRPDAGAPGNWRVCPEQSGGGVLSDVGCHRLDLLSWWFGLPRKVIASVQTRIQPYAAEDEASALMILQNGAPVTVSFHWNSKIWADEIQIVGTDARITLSPCDGDEVQITIGRETNVRNLEKPANGHFPLIDDFARSIVENRMPRFTGADGLLASKLMDAMYVSSREQRWQEVT